MKKLLYIFLPIYILPFIAFAQEILNLEDAVAIALKQNYDIRLVSNDVAIAKNNANLANAGMLPSVTGDASASAATQNTTQTLLSGETRSLKGARNTSMAYGANLDWTVFDGFQMFARYDQLKELQKLGDANLKQAILSTVFNVVSEYFNLVQQKQQLTALRTALDLSKYRLEMAENRYQIGRASKLEVLASKVDLNTDTTNLMRQNVLFSNTKIRLNEILARDVNTLFDVTDSISIEDNLKYDNLLNLALQHNPALQAALINRRIAQLELKEVKGQRYPTIDINSAYTRTRTTAELGFATKNQGNGFSYGVSASMNIFNGFLQKRNERNAALAIENASINLEKTNQALLSQLSSAYQTYLVNLELVDREQGNQMVAKQNMDITLEKYRLGSITPLEFREAQRNYVDASVRFSNAQYEAKMAEIGLKQIAGSLTLN
ncbi:MULTISPECIES: TolC family protein [Olivibacter]|uniref:Outer membrane efflux protein n=3 Tax=Sphingobacteriaceae TaxID=84566 RepID=F4CDX9_SPHS2|nr:MULTISPECIES: TolC family protein [Olivibacter]MCL4637897.1 TolC family protein [Olivibacter sp. UJ_SKK_5.1]MDM8173997.1 TolC family protein [Olivibacter sp. 47]MDX3917021.1 TolC family protein [Pseudosphingobacterium sp.]QEL03782.1 TolC family protein [Olivibacter sp. LS-1]